MHLKKNWTWACNHLESINLSADTFKKHSNSAARYLSRDTVRRYWSAKHYFDSCQLIKTWMYDIRLQAPKLARKCEIGMPVERTDGRSGGRCTVTWLPNFLGWIDFLSYWASNWASDQINYRRKTLNTTWPQWIENEPAIHSGDDGQRIL